LKWNAENNEEKKKFTNFQFTILNFQSIPIKSGSILNVSILKIISFKIQLKLKI